MGDGPWDKRFMRVVIDGKSVRGPEPPRTAYIDSDGELYVHPSVAADARGLPSASRSDPPRALDVSGRQYVPFDWLRKHGGESAPMRFLASAASAAMRTPPYQKIVRNSP